MQIPMLVYGDSFQWPIYGHLILPSNLDLASNNKGSLHQTFWNSLIEFLHTDIDGNLSWWKSIFHLESSYCFQAGSIFVKITRGSVRNCKVKFGSKNVASKKQASFHSRHRWHCIVCNTDSPIHIHKFIPPEVWKAFNVGINAWNITAVLYLNGVSTTWIFRLSWRSFHIHVMVYQMWLAFYSCWFNRRNSIPCTCCNVISLEYDSIPWWPKWQKINVDATSFHLLWQLFTIIKIFSRRFELDWGFKHLSKTNVIWTRHVLWGC